MSRDSALVQLFESTCSLVYECEFLSCDSERAHDHLRNLQVNLFDKNEPPSWAAALFWRIYARFCLRAGDRLRAAEIALNDAILAESCIDDRLLLAGILHSSGQVRASYNELLDMEGSKHAEVARLAIAWELGEQERARSLSVLMSSLFNETESQGIELLLDLVRNFRFGSLFRTIKSLLDPEFLSKWNCEFAVIEAYVLIGERNWRSALGSFQGLHSPVSALIPLLKGECEYRLNDLDAAYASLSACTVTTSVTTSVTNVLEIVEGKGGCCYTARLTVLSRLGEICLRKKRISQAQEFFRSSLEISMLPKPPAFCLTGLSACSLAFSENKSALEFAQKGLLTDPNRPDLWGAASLAALRMEFFSIADTCFDVFLDRLSPGPSVALLSNSLLVELGFAYCDKRPGSVGGGKAEAAALQALRVGGVSPKVNWLLGESMICSKQIDKGVKELLTAVNLFAKLDDNESRTLKEKVINRALNLAQGDSILFSFVKPVALKHAPALIKTD